MSNVKIEVNYSGVGALLKSQEMADVVRSLADSIAASSGPGFASDTYMTHSRVVASAYTSDRDSMLDNEMNNTLLKAVGR